jgi:hypothetical protein
LCIVLGGQSRGKWEPDPEELWQKAMGGEMFTEQEMDRLLSPELSLALDQLSSSYFSGRALHFPLTRNIKAWHYEL